AQHPPALLRGSRGHRVGMHLSSLRRGALRDRDDPADRRRLPGLPRVIRAIDGHSVWAERNIRFRSPAKRAKVVGSTTPRTAGRLRTKRLLLAARGSM